ncbi:hypothetical protein OROGR_016430 [Orobanche gracilis]
MDRISRFQNPIPLSSGGFNKPLPIQNEGLGMKSHPLILDRFRAMMKEREEELRVFGGRTVLPLSTDEIVRLYEIVLAELTINSKPIITDLTIIAGEQRAHGEGIADAICARIIEVSVDQKLPSLYLLDSIVKNIGKEYIKYFSARLPEVFCEAYAQVNPNMHSSMRHLFGTWSTVFPSPVLQKIETYLQFSPSVNGQSSVLGTSKASGSPRPPQGIHINPKYFEAQHQFGHSTVDKFGTEGVSSTGRAGLATSGLDAVKKSMPSAGRIVKSSSPYRIGSLSPSVEEFSIDNSQKGTAVRASPSRTGIEFGLTKLMGRDEETSEWRKRNWQASPSQQFKTSAVYSKYSSGLDLRGPRALISAYGMDEREKSLNHNHHTDEQLDTNGADQNVTIRTWQNTEEEEFDWEDMTPALADRRQSNDNLMARHGFTANHAARLMNDYGGNLSKNFHEKIAGIMPNVAGPSDLTSWIPPNFTRDSLILPHQLSQSHFNANEGRSLSEIRSADASSLTKAWNPAKFQNSHIIPSTPALPPHMQIRGRFGLKNAYADQNYAEQHSGSTRSMPQFTFSQVPNLRPGPVAVNLQNTAHSPLLQPNMLMAQDVRQNLPLSSSNALVPPMNHGYLAQQHGPRSYLPILNAPSMSFHARGPTFQTLHRGPFSSTNQPLPNGQNVGQLAPIPPPGPALSGLISSLVAQGLISLTKQDSIGVEFDLDSLKVRHESTITALYADLPRQCTTCGLRFKTQDEHSKHMDWHVNKNRTIKNRKTKPSPKWFVNATMWLSGAEALGTETAPGFLPANDTVEHEEDEELAVPADEDQNACALCGEPFDDFYSDDTEEWMYRGAVYMYAPGVLTVGMDRSQLGPIVHAKCRSDSNDLKKEEGEPSEDGNQRKRLRSSLS